MDKKKRILIVEDEDHMLSLLRYNLGREDFEIGVAHNGEEGLGEVKKNRPDLIVSDIMMPKMDGYEFCRELRKEPDTKTIPFIFLTARGQLPDKIEGLRTGADDYITKPFVPKELVEMVNARLSRVEIYKEMANSDGLTGFYNQKATKEYLGAEVIRAGRLKIPLSVGFMDIDLFRKVNERFGHPSGDSVLQTVAETIRGMMNKEDVAGRWGGEEFLLILPGVDESEALVRFENIREKISRLTFIDKELTVSFSIGAATYPADAQSAEELVKKADMALLRAKKTGRNRVVSFSGMEKKEI
jgi:diguanylate cyclase (GGDEF)-like protein